MISLSISDDSLSLDTESTEALSLSSGLLTQVSTGDYDELYHKPSINGTTLQGSLDTQDIGLATVAESGSYNDLTDTPTIPTVPTNVSAFNNDANYATETWVENKNYLTSAPVSSVNGKTGTVSLDASDVGALADDTTYVSSFNGSSGAITYSAPVSSVNGQTGAVNLSIPTVNDATLTIQKNGTSVGTFTANASNNKSINIAVPKLVYGSTSDLTPSQVLAAIEAGDNVEVSYADPNYGVLQFTNFNYARVFSALVSQVFVEYYGTTVCFTLSGRTDTNVWYPDMQTLAKLSDLPTVNDATLTIQKNGTPIGTFTANASSNKTINIAESVTSVNGDTGAVTLTASDVSALPDNTTYVESVNGQSGAVTLNIPTVNDATLTIQKNGTSVGTFTANASTATSINLTVPTKTSDLSNDSGFLTSAVTTFNGQSGAVTYSAPVSSVNGQTGVVSLDASDVSALADNTTYVESVNGQSGAVTLSIPTVNDATLTIQKNGVNVDTFTANASSNVTANITVPTATSDLTNDSGFATTNYVDTQDASIQGTLFYGALDGTSTSTVMTATISGITEYKDGLAIFLKNGVVTSASGFTININNLGAKPVYSNMAAATRDTTLFNVNYTMLFVYDSTRVTGGCFVCYRGYYSDSNYYDRFRVANIQLVTGAASGRYSLGFIGTDGKFYGFARTSSTGTSKVLNTGVEFDPAYIFYQLTATYAAGASIATNALYDSYTGIDMRYSCNQGQFATAQKPVYLILHLESSGYFTLGSTIFTQTLPTTADGLYYMPVGIAYSKYQMSFLPKCEILFYDGTKICRYAGSSGSVDSVNGQTGTVVLTASDVGALADNTTYVSSVNGSSGAVTLSIPTKTSDLTNDSGFLTSAPVASVNGHTGAVKTLVSGTTSTLTPTQVLSAIQAGDNVEVTYTHPNYGVLKFTSFNVAEAFSAIVSQTFAEYNGATICFTLSGRTDTNVWYPDIQTLAKLSDLPTVNDATLTIQKNGTSVGTFTANASANKSINVTVPTKTSDLANDSGFVTSNTTYSLSINSNVITLTGSDSSTSTVTLPVYNGGYS